MIELLAFVVAAVIVVAFWRMFAAMAAVAAVFFAIVFGAAYLDGRFDHSVPVPQTARELKLQQFLAPTQRVASEQVAVARFVLYRDDRRMANGRLEQVGAFPSRGGCEIAGRALSESASRVEVHFCEEIPR